MGCGLDLYQSPGQINKQEYALPGSGFFKAGINKKQPGHEAYCAGKHQNIQRIAVSPVHPNIFQAIIGRVCY